PALEIRNVRVLATEPQLVQPVEPFRRSRDVGCAALVRKCRTNEALPRLQLLLRCLGHDHVIQSLTNQVLGVVSGSDLKTRLPWELDVHVPLLLVVRLLDALVATHLHADDHCIPRDTELFLAQVVGRTDDPVHLVWQERTRYDVRACHLALAEAPSADGNTKASPRVMEESLLTVRGIADL